MGFLLFHSRKLLITQMKADLNLRLSIIQARLNKMTSESTELMKKKAYIVNSQMSSLIDSETGAITLDKYQQVISSTADIDVQLKLMEAKEEDMDLEVQKINSELQALVAEEEQIDKALDNSIKKSFGAFANK